MFGRKCMSYELEAQRFTSRLHQGFATHLHPSKSFTSLYHRALLPSSLSLSLSPPSPPCIICVYCRCCRRSTFLPLLLTTYCELCMGVNVCPCVCVGGGTDVAAVVALGVISVAYGDTEWKMGAVRDRERAREAEKRREERCTEVKGRRCGRSHKTEIDGSEGERTWELKNGSE